LDDVVVNELARRVPLWSVLLGIYLAAGFWTLPANVDTALTKVLFGLIAVSLTFLSAAVVTKLTVLYGARFQQALPITSLTQNIARGIVINPTESSRGLCKTVQLEKCSTFNLAAIADAHHVPRFI
jgi:ABC-type Co2+ transport system permease subunit